MERRYGRLDSSLENSRTEIHSRRRQSANRNCCASCSSYSQSGGRDESACSRNRGNENGNDSDKKPKKKKSYWKFFVGLLVVILLILAFTNPGRDTHKQAVKEEVGKVIDKATNISDDFIFADGLRSFAKMISNNMIDVAFDQLFEYHNYIIFSKGTVSFNGKSHNVSFGILGKVYTINADDAIKAMEMRNCSTATTHLKMLMTISRQTTLQTTPTCSHSSKTRPTRLLTNCPTRSVKGGRQTQRKVGRTQRLL